MDAIFLIESRTRCQCIQGDQNQTVEKIFNITLWALIVAFSLGITLSRLATNTWSERHQYRNLNPLSIIIREKIVRFEIDDAQRIMCHRCPTSLLSL
jgi:hypothetical protein